METLQHKIDFSLVFTATNSPCHSHQFFRESSPPARLFGQEPQDVLCKTLQIARVSHSEFVWFCCRPPTRGRGLKSSQMRKTIFRSRSSLVRRKNAVQLFALLDGG